MTLIPYMVTTLTMSRSPWTSSCRWTSRRRSDRFTTPRAYLPFQWALRDLLENLQAVADFNIGQQSPPGLYSFVRHAIRVVGFALLRLHRVEAGETVSPEPRRKRVTTLRQRVPAFDDVLRTPPDAVEIIRAYRARLDDHLQPLGYSEAAQECSPGTTPCPLLHPLWVLPHSKETIEKALRTALGIARNRRIRRNLSVDLERLEDFLPAGAIPSDTLGHIQAWRRVHAPYVRRHAPAG